MTTSKPSRRPVSMARRAICTGVWPATIGRLGTPACSASCASCSCAAGRWVSRLASSTLRRRRSFRRSAILPAVVVLPEPCSPTIRIGTGGAALRLSGTAPSPPSASIIASLTILTTCWPGVTEDSTSVPRARSRDLGDEVAHHGQGHVGVEQGEADLAQGLADVGFGQRAAAGGGGRRRRTACRTGLRTWAAVPRCERSAERQTRRCANLRGAAEPPRRAGTGVVELARMGGLWEVGVGGVNWGVGSSTLAVGDIGAGLGASVAQ